MKPQPSTLLARSACRHIFDSGRRCRFPIVPNASYCIRHIQAQLQSDLSSDLTRHFGPNPLNFKSACEVNDFLCSLAKLVVEDRIAVRRASVLAYIASLELRTLPEIDHELAFDQDQQQVHRIVFDRPEPIEPPLPLAPSIAESHVTTGLTSS